MRIVTGSDDKSAKVWDARAGTHLLELRGHTDAVIGVAFSPDGTRIVTGGDDQTAKVWDARSGTPPVELASHACSVTSVAFSPDGARIITRCGELNTPGAVKVWDAPDRGGTPRT